MISVKSKFFAPLKYFCAYQNKFSFYVDITFIAKRILIIYTTFPSLIVREFFVIEILS